MAAVLGVLNFGLVLLYGVLLSVEFAGGCTEKKDCRAVVVLSFLSLVLQLVCYLLLGLETTRKLYPLISHLPLYLMLTLVFKRPRGVALVSVLTAYFCCQLPRWIGTLTLYLFGTQLAYQIGYMISIFPLFFLLRRYLAMSAYRAMTYSAQSLRLLGGLPLFYYLFDYATTVYTNALYQGIRMVCEFLPAAMALFYVAFVAAYHHEMQRRGQLELDNAMLSTQSQRARHEISALQQIQQQTAVYRHDMRHHLALLSCYLKAGEYEKAVLYIRQTQDDIDRITPVRYCENNAVNLILSSFAAKAKEMGVTLSAEISIPEELPFSETELCALLSNGLENALIAAAGTKGNRMVRLNCQPHKGRLLIFISNPYAGRVLMREGIPESLRAGHGYGVKSIKMIAEKYGGYCAFKAEDDVFTLKVMLPMNGEITSLQRV